MESFELNVIKHSILDVAAVLDLPLSIHRAYIDEKNCFGLQNGQTLYPILISQFIANNSYNTL